MKDYDTYNDNEYGKQPIDAFLQEKGVPYGLPFDRAMTYFRDIIKSFQSAVGWKSKMVDYDFRGASSCYPMIVPDETGMMTLCIVSNDVIVGRFFPTEDNRLGFDALDKDFEFFHTYGDEPNPWYLLSDLMNGKLFLEPANVESMCNETHNGMQVIYGIRIDDVTAFGVFEGNDESEDVKNLDPELVSQISNRFPDGIRWTNEHNLQVSMSRFIERYSSEPGFEPNDMPMPHLLTLVYDGQTIYDEKDLAMAFGKLDVLYDNIDLHASRARFDYELLDYLREEMMAIRDEFERKCGVPMGRHYKFNDALYPLDYFRQDCVSIVTKRAKVIKNVYTVMDGSVYGISWENVDTPVLRPTGLSVSEFIEKSRSRLLSEENVKLGSEEFLSWNKKRTIKNTLKAFEASEHINGKSKGHHI